MTFLQAGTPGAFGSVLSFNLTVPPGVVATDHVLIAVAGVVNVNGADVTGSSPGNPGATFTTIAGGAAVFDNTVWGGLIKGTGLVAGNTITVTLSAARQVCAAHWYFNNDFGTPSAFAARIDSATNVAPNIALAGPDGAKVYVVSLERSTTTGTVITGAVNSNGNTVTASTPLTETGTPTFCTLSLSEFEPEPDDTDSGTTTLTYTNTSTSGLALTIEADVPSGEFDGTHEWAGSFAGTTDPVGSFSGTHQWSGSFAGATVKQGAFSGAHVWSGLFAGGAEAAGGFIGGFSFAGAFAGVKAPGGVFEGNHGWSGSFAGVAPEVPPAVGSFEGAHSWAGNFGSAASVGTFSGGHSWVGSFAGSDVLLPGDCSWPIPAPECCQEWDDASAAQRQRAVLLASDFLWGATGRQFGICAQTVLPCGLACPCSGGPCHVRYDVASDDAYGWSFHPVLLGNGQIANRSCSECSCCSPCEVALPGTVASILSVTIDGEVVPPEAYVVYDHKFLTRIDGSCWPDCQDFGSAPQFLVTYNEGIPVPYAGLQAAADLACALLRTCPDVVDCGSCMANEATESTVVSTWIKQVNPYGVTQSADLVIPGQRGTEESHRQITWSG